jgi:hypothetical protein
MRNGPLGPGASALLGAALLVAGLLIIGLGAIGVHLEGRPLTYAFLLPAAGVICLIAALVTFLRRR